MKSSFFLTTLFSKYQADVHRFISHKFGNSHDAEDIVQDAFHNILRLDEPENLDNARAYLYQTAHNLALNRIRKQRRHDDYLSAQGQQQDTASPEFSVHAQKDLETVEKALPRLPRKCKQAFLLSRVHAKSYDEIAKEMDVSVSSVEKYMIRSLQFLREELGREANG